MWQMQKDHGPWPSLFIFLIDQFQIASFNGASGLFVNQIAHLSLIWYIVDRSFLHCDSSHQHLSFYSCCLSVIPGATYRHHHWIWQTYWMGSCIWIQYQGRVVPPHWRVWTAQLCLHFSSLNFSHSHYTLPNTPYLHTNILVTFCMISL